MAEDAIFVTGASGFIGGALTRALIDDGATVRALARSDAAAAKVEALGAEPVRGDLSAPGEIRAAATGCRLAFHAAALPTEWGTKAEFEAANVTGTANVLGACEAAGVGRLVHVGTEAACFAMKPLVRIDETAPLQPDSPVLYSATKAQAEQLVVGANRSGFETIVLRPRLVWGPGDVTVLPGFTEAVENGRFSWVGGGTHLTSTSHVDNVVHGLRLAAEKGRPGEAYFVTDGEPVVFREFITRLLATEGVTPPERNLPAPVARVAATASEALWRLLPLPGAPPITRLAYFLTANEVTIDISKARAELGYEPLIEVDRGLSELAAAAAEPLPAMSLPEVILVLVAGFGAGVINALIGSGTLITFPALLAVGYPPVVANVSNSLGLVPGAASSAYGYRRELAGSRERLLRFAPLTATGAVVGAVLLLALPESAFEVIVPILIAISLVLIIAQPRISAWVKARREAEEEGRAPAPHGGPAVQAGIFGTGIYGGYFGAGQGILLLAILAIGVPGELKDLNAVRAVLAGVANLVAGIVFLFIADIAWLPVLLIAISSTVGGLVGAGVGRRLPDPALRAVIVVVGLAAIAQLVL